MVQLFCKYQNGNFADCEEYFERPFNSDGRPPVFHKKFADNNVIFNPDSSPQEHALLLKEIPPKERHRWFRSMSSSQAVAQSILGNLKVHDRLRYLYELTDDTGLPLLGDARLYKENFHMEYTVDYLNEPRPTSLDGFISGDYRVAIECKLMEPEVGTCSRPRLRKIDKNYEKDYCNGTYTYQKGRKTRCSLTEIGISYWKYIPDLFKWNGDVDQVPCPLRNNYQLVRNSLAACVRPDGSVLPEKGHVVLIYDERNPAFQKGGKGYTAFEDTKEALHEPQLLRKCSWQSIVNHLRNKNELSWLVDQLELKYGL
ncbi:MAG: hypothetical protein JW743_02310 [Deltaproteobacteria bacterium]|nr:hypothetical protein [Deltaproteobacteria bacterium]MBN2845467.1 hypothetical protein [Deltaproteobacteria bacterium]